jgi:hypothetical protein
MAPNGLNKIWSVDFMHDTTYDGSKRPGKSPCPAA